MNQLPEHLKKYIVKQNYECYTSRDQAVWRYCLRQLKNFLKTNAHESYISGLEKTGISTEEIPKISDISEKLEKFGWRALPVSGFIPPAAFMELQSLSVLPIASDMRSLQHLEYTPAPDIVHEAAGHAPFLADPEYAEYLKKYSQVAKKAILSKEDLNLYEAIRVLSDVKENPNSTEADIQKAEAGLATANKNMTHVSEASQLSRMNWWTAEYGLIGSLDHPKIFGAGLLSSVGESKWCLSKNVKKIPLTADCVHQSYDITEPQPQLFVTPSFKHLETVLDDFSKTMAYKIGGQIGLEKALQSKALNTIELDSGLQISGVLKNYTLHNEHVSFLQFEGPTQLSYKDKEISGHDKNYHPQGYSTPLGPYQIKTLDHHHLEIHYDSGVLIKGEFEKEVEIGSTRILTLKKATVTYNHQILFHPEWGSYDICFGSLIKSVFGGPADRKSYGETTDFIAARVSMPKYSEEDLKIFQIYNEISLLRKKTKVPDLEIENILNDILKLKNAEWLMFLDLYEISKNQNNSSVLSEKIMSYLVELKNMSSKNSELITEGLNLIHGK